MVKAVDPWVGMCFSLLLLTCSALRFIGLINIESAHSPSVADLTGAVYLNVDRHSPTPKSHSLAD